MASSNNLIKHSDSLIELLAAQCVDLEKLLSLAKEETAAAEQGKFLKIWDIVSQRTAIGKRLETFHHQISEIRSHLESKGENLSQYDITNRVIELANLTLLQDQQTRFLLTESRKELSASLVNLDKSHHGTNAYLRENTKGLACDRSF
jgi:flagellar biosynthesis/type III secretory pathway chaperone